MASPHQLLSMSTVPSCRYSLCQLAAWGDFLEDFQQPGLQGAHYRQLLVWRNAKRGSDPKPPSRASCSKAYNWPKRTMTSGAINLRSGQLNVGGELACQLLRAYSYAPAPERRYS
jgi:hypothetical protein